VQEMLQGYGLVRPDLRLVFHCDVQPTIAWSKAPAASQKQAVAALFGAPLARALQDIEFAMPLSSRPALDNSDNVDQDQGEAESPPVRVRGLVPQPGATLQVIGRTTGDRYFIFVNGRPVQLPEVAKAARRAWRQGEKTRYHPFVYLDITVPHGTYVSRPPPPPLSRCFCHSPKNNESAHFTNGQSARLNPPHLAKHNLSSNSRLTRCQRQPG
jgi:DNA mismatch repair ATPase MutL